MENKLCWKKCNKRGGQCSYCNGYCCNGKKGSYPGWNGDCPAAAIAVAPLNGHRCIRPTEISTTEIRTTETTIPNCKLLIIKNSILLLPY